MSWHSRKLSTLTRTISIIHWVQHFTFISSTVVNIRNDWRNFWIFINCLLNCWNYSVFLWETLFKFLNDFLVCRPFLFFRTCNSTYRFINNLLFGQWIEYNLLLLWFDDYFLRLMKLNFNCVGLIQKIFLVSCLGRNELLLISNLKRHHLISLLYWWYELRFVSTLEDTNRFSWILNRNVSLDLLSFSRGEVFLNIKWLL